MSYKQAADQGTEMILSFLKKRMKEKKLTQKDLAVQLNVSVTTLIRYWKRETPMPLSVLLEILGVLEIRPYFIPSELDNTEMQRMFFN